MSRKRTTDDELISALLQNKTQRQAAQFLGLSENTISRRMQNESFKLKLSERRKALFDAVNTQLVNAAGEAATALIKLLESQNESIRYSTACRILSLTESYLTATEILSRLEALEQQYVD